MGNTNHVHAAQGSTLSKSNGGHDLLTVCGRRSRNTTRPWLTSRFGKCSRSYLHNRFENISHKQCSLSPLFSPRCLSFCLIANWLFISCHPFTSLSPSSSTWLYSRHHREPYLKSYVYRHCDWNIMKNDIRRRLRTECFDVLSSNKDNKKSRLRYIWRGRRVLWHFVVTLWRIQNKKSLRSGFRVNASSCSVKKSCSLFSEAPFKASSSAFPAFHQWWGDCDVEHIIWLCHML